MTNGTLVCKVCGEVLDSDLTLFESEGRVQYKDERHIIRHNHISSDTASRMGSSSRLSNRQKADADELSEALKTYLISDDTPKSQALGIIIDKLSLGASIENASAIKNLETLLKLIGEHGGLKPPLLGERCSLCKNINGEKEQIIKIGVGGSEALLRLLEERAKHQLEIAKLCDKHGVDFKEFIRAAGEAEVQRMEHIRGTDYVSFLGPDYLMDGISFEVIEAE